MFFHMPQKRIQLHLTKIAGEEIAFVDNFNFPGIIINKHLNWTSHVYMLTAKLSETIGILNTLKLVLAINIMRTVYNSLILCHLNYGVLLWGPKLHVNDKLHIIFFIAKKAVRIITCNIYFAHSEPLFKQLRLLKTCDIYKCQLLKFIFKLIHKQLPHYCKQFTFTFRNQQHNYATRTCQNVFIPNVSHEFPKSRTSTAVAPRLRCDGDSTAEARRIMLNVSAVPPRRSAVLTVFGGATTINDETTAELRRSWRCHCGSCRTSTAVAPRIRCDGDSTAETRRIMLKVSAVPPRRSAVLTVFGGATTINDETTAELRRSWRCHCGSCRTSTAVAPRIRCDGGIITTASQGSCCR